MCEFIRQRIDCETEQLRLLTVRRFRLEHALRSKAWEKVAFTELSEVLTSVDARIATHESSLRQLESLLAETQKTRR